MSVRKGIHPIIYLALGVVLGAAIPSYLLMRQRYVEAPQGAVSSPAPSVSQSPIPSPSPLTGTLPHTWEAGGFRLSLQKVQTFARAAPPYYSPSVGKKIVGVYATWTNLAKEERAPGPDAPRFPDLLKLEMQSGNIYDSDYACCGGFSNKMDPGATADNWVHFEVPTSEVPVKLLGTTASGRVAYIWSL